MPEELVEGEQLATNVLRICKSLDRSRESNWQLTYSTPEGRLAATCSKAANQVPQNVWHTRSFS